MDLSHGYIDLTIRNIGNSILNKPTLLDYLNDLPTTFETVKKYFFGGSEKPSLQGLSGSPTPSNAVKAEEINLIHKTEDNMYSHTIYKAIIRLYSCCGDGFMRAILNSRNLYYFFEDDSMFHFILRASLLTYPLLWYESGTIHDFIFKTDILSDYNKELKKLLIKFKENKYLKNKLTLNGNYENKIKEFVDDKKSFIEFFEYGVIELRGIFNLDVDSTTNYNGLTDQTTDGRIRTTIRYIPGYLSTYYPTPVMKDYVKEKYINPTDNLTIRLRDFARLYCAVCSLLSSLILKKYIYKYGYRKFENIKPYIGNPKNLYEILTQKYTKPVLFRGMDNRNNSNNYIDPGYISTSYNIEVALGFARGTDSNYSTKYPNGTTLFAITQVEELNCIHLKPEYTSYYDESEILFCGPVKYVVLADDEGISGTDEDKQLRIDIQVKVNYLLRFNTAAQYSSGKGVKVVLVLLLGVNSDASLKFETTDPTGIYDNYTVANTKEEMKKIQDECLIKVDSDIRLLSL